MSIRKCWNWFFLSSVKLSIREILVQEIRSTFKSERWLSVYASSWSVKKKGRGWESRYAVILVSKIRFSFLWGWENWKDPNFLNTRTLWCELNFDLFFYKSIFQNLYHHIFLCLPFWNVRGWNIRWFYFPFFRKEDNWWSL